MAKNKSTYIFAISNAVERELAEKIYKEGIQLGEIYRPAVGTIPNYYNLIHSSNKGFFSKLYCVKANDINSDMGLISEFIQNIEVSGAWDRKAFECIDDGVNQYGSIGKGQRIIYWKNTKHDRVDMCLVVKSTEPIVEKSGVAIFDTEVYLEDCRRAVRGY